MAKLLIYGNPNSPLVQQRGLIGHQAGHEIIWFSPKQADLENVSAYFMPKYTQENALLRAFLEPFYLQHVITQQKPDLIHVHYALKGLAAIPLSKFHPLIVSTMGSDILPNQSYKGLYKPFTQLLLNHADCITSKSDYMDSAIKKIGDFQDKLQRVTWGVDLDKFHPNRDTRSLRSKLQIDDKSFIFLDPRSARPLYNKHIILESFSKFLNQVDNSVLLISEIFADQSYLKRIKKQALQLGILDNVRFLGSIPSEDMSDYYNLADITVSVPSSDGLPQTIYEAFACGSYLIAGDLPQYNEVLRDYENARTVVVGNPDDLARAMIWTYENPGLREQASKLNLEYVREHADYSQQAALVNRIYHQLINSD